MLWLRNPRVEIAIPAAIHSAPREPIAARITSDAGVVVASKPAGPSTRRHTARVAHFTGNKSRGLPSAISKRNGNHRGPDACQNAKRKRRDRQRLGFERATAERESKYHQPSNRRDP